MPRKTVLKGRGFKPIFFGKKFETINPATGEVICDISEADAADVDKAVVAAKQAFEGEWRKMSATRRGELLYKLADLIEQNIDDLARLETLDNGKPLTFILSNSDIVFTSTWERG